MAGMPFLRAATREALALTGHLLLYPTGICPERDPDLEEAQPTATLSTRGVSAPPVLLLHGFCDNRSTFVMLRRSLLGNGWPHVYCLNHSPLTWDIHEAVETLDTRVKEICSRTGHERVDVVGHSLGGLIGRCYAQLHGGDAHVRTLVTLGTPHAGTYTAAALTPHPVARQMVPGSGLLEELAAPVPGGSRTRFVSVWGDHDLFVVPARSGRLEHPDLAVTNVRVRGVGHLMLPVDRTVTAWIRDELADGHGPEADTTQGGGAPASTAEPGSTEPGTTHLDTPAAGAA
ncbi:alpha/beta fold hydrolase [Streptomyces sp. RKND-216]|uniref:alpha/beta fold hydrolase n=1 Tax=Streptomyces sp. RKND-216 TaxID=2562581 RepID=UPI00109D8437|nr:alpha/beta fold hydrolase [Streptomyces sp. RKND-216]THA24900.1 alpha/beta fold hydrolase [Streptomyces sp. RKND-216]